MQGQSNGIAWIKMIGSLIVAIGFCLWCRSDLIAIVTMDTLIIDLVCLRFLYSYSKPRMASIGIGDEAMLGNVFR